MYPAPPVTRIRFFVGTSTLYAFALFLAHFHSTYSRYIGT